MEVQPQRPTMWCLGDDDASDPPVPVTTANLSELLAARAERYSEGDSFWHYPDHRPASPPAFWQRAIEDDGVGRPDARWSSDRIPRELLEDIFGHREDYRIDCSRAQVFLLFGALFDKALAVSTDPDEAEFRFNALFARPHSRTAAEAYLHRWSQAEDTSWRSFVAANPPPRPMSFRVILGQHTIYREGPARPEEVATSNTRPTAWGRHGELGAVSNVAVSGTEARRGNAGYNAIRLGNDRYWAHPNGLATLVQLRDFLQGSYHLDDISKFQDYIPFFLIEWGKRIALPEDDRIAREAAQHFLSILSEIDFNRASIAGAIECLREPATARVPAALLRALTRAHGSLPAHDRLPLSLLPTCAPKGRRRNKLELVLRNLEAVETGGTAKAIAFLEHWLLFLDGPLSSRQKLTVHLQQSKVDTTDPAQVRAALAALLPQFTRHATAYATINVPPFTVSGPNARYSMLNQLTRCYLQQPEPDHEAYEPLRQMEIGDPVLQGRPPPADPPSPLPEASDTPKYVVTEV